MPDRSSDFSTEVTFQWLKRKFGSYRRWKSNSDGLVGAITAEMGRAYRSGREDGLATAAEIAIADIRAERLRRRVNAGRKIT